MFRGRSVGLLRSPRVPSSGSAEVMPSMAAQVRIDVGSIMLSPFNESILRCSNVTCL